MRKVFCILSFITCLSGSFTFAEDETPITRFHVAQETSRKNGVLVSRPNPQHQDIVDLIVRQNIQSLEDYTRWLTANIHYKNDGQNDTWSEPHQTLRAKTGDCEDYALLNATVIEVLGFKPHFLALVKKGNRAHAICTFQHNGRLLWFDNAKLIKTSKTSLEQLAQSISKDYGYSSLLEYDLKTKKWDVLYNKYKTYAHRPSVSPQVTLSSP